MGNAGQSESISIVLIASILVIARSLSAAFNNLSARNKVEAETEAEKDKFLLKEVQEVQKENRQLQQKMKDLQSDTQQNTEKLSKVDTQETVLSNLQGQIEEMRKERDECERKREQELRTLESVHRVQISLMNDEIGRRTKEMEALMDKVLVALQTRGVE